MKKMVLATLLCVTFVSSSSLIYANQIPLLSNDASAAFTPTTLAPTTTSVNNSEAGNSVKSQVVKAQLNTNQKVIKGRFTIPNRKGLHTPVKQALVELVYEKMETTSSSKVSTYTNENGEFELRYNLPNDIQSGHVRFTLDNNFVRIENPEGTVYSQRSLTYDLSQSAITINQFLPNTSDMKSAGWLFDDLMQAREKLKELKISSKKVAVVWSSTTVDQDGWLAKENKIKLSANAPTNKSTIYFLFAQKYMYDQYDRVLPENSSCSTGVSYQLSTNSQCAWTQGWAYFLSMWMNNSSTFTYSNGNSWDGENTSFIDTIGDKVEGRVAGVLWDLYDTANDGFDTVNYPIEQIFQTMYESRIYSIGQYWKKWGVIGFDANAEKAFRQNKVLFDEFTILEPGVPLFMNGESEKVFELIGYDGYPTIETAYFHEKVDTRIEIFNDKELKSRAAVDDDSRGNGYSIINNHRFVKGKKYYLKITNFDAGKAIYAKVSYTQVTNVDMSNQILTPTTPGFVNGESIKTFDIVGNGKTVTIETSRFGDKYDTVLELFSNEWSYPLLESNDNTKEDNYSRITRKLEKGKKYILAVTNHYRGKPVCAKVSIKEID